MLGRLGIDFARRHRPDLILLDHLVEKPPVPAGAG